MLRCARNDAREDPRNDARGGARNDGNYPCGSSQFQQAPNWPSLSSPHFRQRHASAELSSDVACSMSCCARAKWLRDLLIIEKPALVIYEAPLLRAAAKGSAEAMRLLIGLAFQTEVICAIRGITSHECHVASWRKAFLGHGYPHDPKQAALNMCGLLGWDTGGSHDRADAIGCWVWGHYTHGDRRAIQRALSASSMRAMV